MKELPVQFATHTRLEDLIVEQAHVDKAQQQYQHAVPTAEAYAAQRVLVVPAAVVLV